ncbi:MAG: hypothetical protein KIS67_11320 [Verrucomicrobiae bacterium]|nr:hypothetical protein [Verrucomicrobiae bacterium]
MKTKTWESPIVLEVRKVKERLAAKFNYDVDAMFRDLRERQKTSGHRYIDLSKPGRKTAVKRAART